MTAPKLPNLPRAKHSLRLCDGRDVSAYTADNMDAYGIACAAAALEEAANVCNSLVLKQPHRLGCEACYRCEEAIRELKEKV